MILKNASTSKVNADAYFANESYVTFIGLVILFTIGHRLKVDVYYNFHKECFSIQYKGLVIAYAQWVQLEDVKFVVRASGRLRSLFLNRKTVHAFARGYLVAMSDEVKPAPDNMRCVSYNRHLNTSFVLNAGTSEETPVYSADWCIVADKAVWLEKTPTIAEEAIAPVQPSEIIPQKEVCLNEMPAAPTQEEAIAPVLPCEIIPQKEVCLNEMLAAPTQEEAIADQVFSSFSSPFPLWVFATTCLGELVFFEFRAVETAIALATPPKFWAVETAIVPPHQNFLFPTACFLDFDVHLKDAGYIIPYPLTQQVGNNVSHRSHRL